MNSHSRSVKESSGIYACFFILVYFLGASHVIGFFIPNSLAFIFGFALLFFLYFISYTIKVEVLLVVISFFFLGVLVTLLGGNTSTWTTMLYFSMSLLVVAMLDMKVKKLALDYLANIFILMLVLAWVGVFYKMNGGEPLMIFTNPDGRPNYLMLSTFSNANYQYWMRPSGVFDEPGAFSFHCCCLIFFRYTFNRCWDWKNTTILVLGFVTVSLAHVIFAAFCALGLILRKMTVFYYFKLFLFFILFVGFFLVVYNFNASFSSIVDVFLARLEFDPSKGFSGNSRSGNFSTALSLLSINNFIYGLQHELCSIHNSCVSIYGSYKENLLYPLIQYGIFLSAIYYLSLGFFLVVCAYRLDFIGLGFVLLWTQRPYFITVGYTVWFALLCFLLVMFLRRKIVN